MNDIPSHRRALEAARSPENLTELEDDLDYEQHLECATVEAVAALRRIMRSGKSDAAIVSAANAVLDRALGKPVQTTLVNQNTTYTIIAAIPAPPNSLGHSQPVVDISATD